MKVLTILKSQTVLFWTHSSMLANHYERSQRPILLHQNFKKFEWPWLTLSVKFGMSEKNESQAWVEMRFCLYQCLFWNMVSDETVQRVYLESCAQRWKDKWENFYAQLIQFCKKRLWKEKVNWAVCRIYSDDRTFTNFDYAWMATDVILRQANVSSRKMAKSDKTFWENASFIAL